MTAAAITAPPMRRLTSVELRKMTDTRAGFWLLLLVVLSALAGGVALARLGPAEGAGLEQLFFDLTAEEAA